MRNDSLEDEGLLTVQSAMEYLEPSEDEDDVEAHDILRCSEYLIEREYSCHFCGNWIGNRKDKYCSKSCYRADMEGL